MHHKHADRIKLHHKYRCHAEHNIWTDQVEASAEQQLTALGSCPFVFHQVAAMPAVHDGIGATIGSVFATNDVMLPTAVGMAIDCGMRTQPVNRRAVDLSARFLRDLHEQTNRDIATGLGPPAGPQVGESFKPVRYTDAIAHIVRDSNTIPFCSL